MVRAAFSMLYLASLALGLGVPAAATAETQPGVRMFEHRIKAGLLYNFLKYVDWPANERPTIAVCVLGDDPFEGALAPMQGRTVNQQKIELRTIDEIRAAASCQLVFVEASARRSWPELERSLEGKPVLTVADSGGFVRSGGMIEFGRDADRIEVTMNLGAVSAAGLEVQDRLRRLVEIVQVP